MLFTNSHLAAVGLAGLMVVAVDVNPAKAVLNYNIYESSGNLVIEASGSLDLPSSTATSSCGLDGFTNPSIAIICTGPNAIANEYSFSSGPLSIGTSSSLFATSVSGIATILGGGVKSPNPGSIAIDSSYTNGSPIISSAIFNGKTLADLGLTSTSGTIGTWTLVGTGDTVNVNVVPGPLPLLGAGAAFGFSRRLRQRIQRNKGAASV
jgi:hypothetical protein